MNAFRGALDLWISTWKDNRILFWIEFMGTIIGAMCAITINVSAAHPPMLGILTGYFVSAVLLSYASHIRKSPFMFMLMGFYSLTSAYGICVLLI